MLTLNGRGDLAFDGEIKPYIRTEVTLVKITKSGLYQVRALDGTLLSVPKRNLDGLPVPEVLGGVRLDSR